MKTGLVYAQMLKWQSIATVTVALLMLFAGVFAALSALLGGLAVILGSLAGAWIAKTGDHKEKAGAILIAMLKGEAVKILIIALVLFLVFKLYRELVPMALILGLAASAIVSGMAFNGLNKR
jgi:ATP synthase protein I